MEIFLSHSVLTSFVNTRDEEVKSMNAPSIWIGARVSAASLWARTMARISLAYLGC
jgi:hypothetical protein